jgi:hypothetical protein
MFYSEYVLAKKGPLGKVRVWILGNLSMSSISSRGCVCPAQSREAHKD